ncbi:Myelin protein zero-like protein 3 Precursor [Larimichthys crocea]|uniref:Myelin protein zero-like protein 3 n=2 Tax=Larimichthys crocea TaxID=215358 RepID=A0A6G0IVK4_LARCR|nr:myelin protein zero-like protein 3 [Larimichthys crocea]KAE8295548.1 Myelin protein zero-like protein 3 Precursor [Larimichthys crocea]
MESLTQLGLVFFRPIVMRVNSFSHLKMRRPHRGSTALNVVLLLYLVTFFAPSLVSSITVSTPAELHASKGDTVTFSCTFTSSSSPTSKMTVDWSYRPQSGGPPQTFFHFSSRAFPPLNGQFSGRIRWQGSPAQGEASISLINATLNDNGTYTCSVRNPPDVHGSPTSHTVLTVTPKAPSIRFSDVAVLLAFILLPSGIITLILIGRMLCPKKRRSQSKTYRSPIEVTEGEEYGIHPPEDKVKRPSCCELYLMDSEDEDVYYDLKKRPHMDEGYAESQC